MALESPTQTGPPDTRLRVPSTGRVAAWLRGEPEPLAEPRSAPRAAETPDTKAPILRRAITLLIPALNEERGLAGTIAEARRISAEADLAAEIVVVDDGSHDNTADVARRGGARVVRHLYGRGYGYALRSGVLAARHDTIVICDADGTYPLDRLPDLLAKFDQGYDLVIGARTGRHYLGAPTKALARKFFRRMCETATGTKVLDANSGLRVFRKHVILPHLPMMCTGFSFTTSQTLCYLLLSRPVAYVPIEYRARVGKTKVRHLSDSIRTAQYIFQMFAIFNPVKLFTMLAIPPALVAGTLVGVQAVGALFGRGGSWFQTGVLSGMGIALSALLFGMGFVVYGVARQRWPDPISGRASRPVLPPRA